MVKPPRTPVPSIGFSRRGAPVKRSLSATVSTPIRKHPTTLISRVVTGNAASPVRHSREASLPLRHRREAP